MIADEQVVLHRTGRNLERLDHEGADEERQDDRDHDRLEVFADRRFLETLSHDVPERRPASAIGLCAHSEHSKKRFLWNLHLPNALHPLLSFLLLFEQLAFARNVAAVTLGQHVLAHGLYRLSRDDA